MNANLYIQDIIYKLISEYPMYGYLYDDDGTIKIRYRMPYCEYDENGEEGPLLDAEGYEIIYSPQYDGDEDYQLLSPYMDVHCYKVFENTDYDKIKNMSCGEILDTYIKFDIKKLLTMLRRGFNYASQTPVPPYISDDELSGAIAITWKLIVMNTIANARNIKANRLPKMEQEALILSVIGKSFSGQGNDKSPIDALIKAINDEQNSNQNDVDTSNDDSITSFITTLSKLHL